MGRGLIGRYSLDARRRGVKGILELVLLNKRVSNIDTLFHTDEEVPLQAKRLRILDSIILFAADVLLC